MIPFYDVKGCIKSKRHHIYFIKPFVIPYVILLQYCLYDISFIYWVLKPFYDMVFIVIFIIQ